MCVCQIQSRGCDTQVCEIVSAGRQGRLPVMHLERRSRFCKERMEADYWRYHNIPLEEMVPKILIVLDTR